LQSLVIIANRGAGTFSQQTLDSACRRLEAAGYQLERLFCGDFSEMTATAARVSREPHAPLVIAAGGDGTINAVFNGLAGNNATCAILPLGTANVLAIELGLNSLEAATQKIIAGASRPFTAGFISRELKSSRFFLMAGAGFDGTVVRGVTAGLKQRFGKGAYLLSGLRGLAAWERAELEITADGRQFACHSIIVCNAAHYGGPFRLAPAASIFTPTLELLAVTSCSRSGVLSLAAEALCGSRSNALLRCSAKDILITGKKPVQVDGDDWGDAPVAISAENNFARIIV
jgi:diacylglycerol kinase family enzyme